MLDRSKGGAKPLGGYLIYIYIYIYIYNNTEYEKIIKIRPYPMNVDTLLNT